jgi:hypothetical protein
MRHNRIGDSEYGHWRDSLELPTTEEQDTACIALERMGQRFLVDYGYENAQSKLGELMLERIEKTALIM